MGEGAAIHSIEPARVAGGLGENLLETARYAVDDDREIVAFGMVALYRDGTTMAGGNVSLPEDLPYMNRYIFLQLCKERLREKLITDEAARHIVNRANGFDD